MNINLEINKTEILRNKLLEIYLELYKQNLESNNKLVFKGYRSKKFVFLDAVFKIKRRIYLNSKTNKYVYLLDEHLNLDKYTHYDQQFTNKIFSLVYEDKISYSSVQKYVGIKFSKCNVYNLLKKKKKCFNQYKNKIIDPSKYKYLYINIDDCFMNTIQNRKKIKNRYRVVCVHQGYDANNNLINKSLITFKNPKWAFEKELQLKLIELYGNISKFKIIILGDGAKFIKSLSKELKAEIVLDKFHCFKEIRSVFNYYSKNRNLKDKESNNRNKLNLKIYKEINSYIYKKEFDNLFCFLNQIKRNDFSKQKQKDINRLIKYLKNNLSGIKNWFNKSFYSKCLTETFVQSVVKWIKGDIGKIYSSFVLDNMIRQKSILCNQY